MAPLIQEQIGLQETLDGLNRKLEESNASLGKKSFDAWRTITAAIAENTGLMGENLEAQDKVLSGDLFKEKPPIKATKELFGLGESADKTKKKIRDLQEEIGGFNFTKLQANIKRAARVLEKAGRFEIKIEISKDVSGLADKVGELIDETAAVAAAKAKAIGEAISDSIKNGLQGLATESLTLLGEFLGQAISGNENALENLGQGLLNAVGNFMTQFGQAMISLGIAQSALGAAITAGPAGAPLAIAAGIALVAAGAAISSLSKQGIQPSGGGGGGGVSTARPVTSFRGGAETSELIIDGRKLIIIQQREKGFRR